jgi:hypothetical protein
MHLAPTSLLVSAPNTTPVALLFPSVFRRHRRSAGAVLEEVEIDTGGRYDDDGDGYGLAFTPPTRLRSSIPQPGGRFCS